MRLPLWLDVDWEYCEGEIVLASVRVFDNEILQHLSRYELEKIKQHCLEKQKEIWSEQA
jgi:hypothetical protein